VSDRALSEEVLEAVKEAKASEMPEAVAVV